LVKAIAELPEGSAIDIAAGTFRLPKALSPKSGMKITGAGIKL